MKVKSMYKNCFVVANGTKYNFNNFECDVTDPKALEEMRAMQALTVPEAAEKVEKVEKKKTPKSK